MSDCLLDHLRSMGANIDTPVDEDFPLWVLSLVFIQVVLTFIGIHGIFIFALLFNKRTLFHRNLNILAINTAILWLLVMLCRFIVSFAGLLNWRIIAIQAHHVVMKPFIYIELARVAFGYAALSSTGAIVLERVVATIYMGSYERKTHPIFVFFVIISIWLFGIVSAIYAFGRPHASLFTVLGLTIVGIFVVVGYYYAVLTNRRHLEQSKIKSFEYTLSQRFQLQENMRMIGIIRRCLITFMPLLLILGLIWFTLFIIYNQNKNKTVYYLMRETSRIASCLCANVLLFACTTGTYAWTNEIKSFFQKIRHRFRKNSRFPEKIKPKIALVNTDGQQIGGFGVGYEAEMYFVQLNSEWNREKL